MAEKVPVTGEDWQVALREAISAINDKDCFFFSASQDADSVGSLVALALYLTLLGKKVFLFLPDPVDSRYSYLEEIIHHNYLRVIDSEEGLRGIQDQVEAVIFFDTPNSDLIPFFPCISECLLSGSPAVIEIDHHFGNDSKGISHGGIHLFRQSNATAEIVAELLGDLYEINLEFPNPLEQRNILVALMTGLLGDSIGGEASHCQSAYDRLMGLLRVNLKKQTNLDAIEQEPRFKKIASPEDVLEYFDQMTREHELCFQTLEKKISCSDGVGFINLLDSTFEDCEGHCKPYDSQWFVEVREALLNKAPERSGKIGVLCCHGKTASGQNCIFLRIRRSARYKGFDLRQAENDIKNVFGAKYYLGGGGHPGAVSFRLQSHDEEIFLRKAHQVSQILKSRIR